jgi:uncharacterized membrane protein YesL
MVRMQFIYSKLVGLLSLIGTIVGLVFGGATVQSNALVGALFFLLAAVAFIVFVAFLYNFIRYAQYEMPLDNVQDEIESEER